MSKDRYIELSNGLLVIMKSNYEIEVKKNYKVIAQVLELDAIQPLELLNRKIRNNIISHQLWRALDIVNGYDISIVEDYSNFIRECHSSVPSMREYMGLNFSVPDKVFVSSSQVRLELRNTELYLTVPRLNLNVEISKDILNSIDFTSNPVKRQKLYVVFFNYVKSVVCKDNKFVYLKLINLLRPKLDMIVDYIVNNQVI